MAKRIMSEEARQKISKAVKARWRRVRKEKRAESRAAKVVRREMKMQTPKIDEKIVRTKVYDEAATMAISHDEVPDLMNRIAHQLLIRALGGRS